MVYLWYQNDLWRLKSVEIRVYFSRLHSWTSTVVTTEQRLNVSPSLSLSKHTHTLVKCNPSLSNHVINTTNHTPWLLCWTNPLLRIRNNNLSLGQAGKGIHSWKLGVCVFLDQNFVHFGLCCFSSRCLFKTSGKCNFSNRPEHLYGV